MFFVENSKITTATDIGHMNRELLEYIEGSDFSLKKRILGDKGHLSNEMAGKVVAHLAERGTRCFMLGHLSKEETVRNILKERNIDIERDIKLSVALRDKVGQVVEI